MKKVNYQKPVVRELFMENLMDIGIHNSEGDPGELAKPVDVDEEPEVLPHSSSVWDD